MASHATWFKVVGANLPTGYWFAEELPEPTAEAIRARHERMVRNAKWRRTVLALTCQFLLIRNGC